MVQYRRISWWYWLVMTLLLAAGLGGWAMGFPLAVILGVVQTLHFWIEDRSIRAFPVQVRLAYLALLVLGQWVPANGLYWFMFIGTTAMVLFRYCFLARTVSLLPWNRSEPLSLAMLQQTYFAPPRTGNVRQGLPVEAASARGAGGVA
jgi:hypothetical protein